MRIIQQVERIGPDHRCICAAIGMFDGVHLGHQHVLAQTVRDARERGGIPVAVTFDQHPNAVLAPPKAPLLIYSLAQRLKVIASMGIEVVLMIHFDLAFSQQSGEEFVLSLVNGFGCLGTICIGQGFTFGHRRSVDVALLQLLGAKLGFAVRDLPPVLAQGAVVSSTRIRQAIQDGHLQEAAELLGRPYSISGQTRRGEQVGRQLGFPTANLDTAGLALPPAGVYAGRAATGGQAYAAVANLGYRPTFNHAEAELRLEVHLLDFAGDLYGHEVEFAFARALRGEAKFGSIDELRLQIQKDIAAARAMLG